jgi:cytochrome P450
MIELFLRPAVLGPAVAIVAFIVHQFVIATLQRPKLPVVGSREGDWFPFYQAAIRNTLDFKSAVLEAEEKYREQTVLMPFLGTTKTVVLPRSQIQWISDQPESVLSMHVKTMDDLQIDYTVTDPSLIYNPLHTKIITTTLTREIGNLVPDVADEAAWAFGEAWGSPSDYKEVCVYDTLRKIIGHVSNRVFVGKPHCRNQAMLQEGVQYAKDVPLMANILRLVWKPLRPTVALFLTILIHLRTRRFRSILRATIEQRLAEYDARQQGLGDKAGAEPNDFLQWSIRQAKSLGDPYMWRPETFADRILLLNFASIHTSSFAITNAILELSASKQEYIDELRAEIEGILAEYGGQWNKRALSRMHKLDSVLRESSRLNSFVTVGVARYVTAPDGAVTPSGVKVPHGWSVVGPSYPVFHDENVYPGANEFRPFRFAEERSDQNIDYVKRATKAFATTSPDYLAFGHGRNACPGRFFAASELKLLVAHLVLNYDIKLMPERPRNMWISINRVPPLKATIRIKKRVRG